MSRLLLTRRVPSCSLYVARASFEGVEKKRIKKRYYTILVHESRGLLAKNIGGLLAPARSIADVGRVLVKLFMRIMLAVFIHG